MARVNPVLPRFVDGRTLAPDVSMGASALGQGLGQLMDRRRQAEAQKQQEAKLGDLQETFQESFTILNTPAEQRQETMFNMANRYRAMGDVESAMEIEQLMQMDNNQLEGTLRSGIMTIAPQIGVDTSRMFGSDRSGMASAKTEIYPDGTTVQALPNGEVQVQDPSGKIVTGQERLDVLKAAQASRAGQAGAVVSAQEKAKTKEMKRRESALKSQAQSIEQQSIELLQKQAEFDATQAKQEIQEQTAGDLFGLGVELLDSDLDSIYGRGESLYPDLFRGQQGIDLIAKRNRFVAALELAAAGKMKGQGTLSDSERKILKEGATTLSNPDISAEAAQAEIQRILPTYAKAANAEWSPEQADVTDEQLLDMY